MEEPRNEPVLQYKNGSEERHLLDLALAKYWDNVTDISAVLDPGFTDSTSSAKELHMQYVVRISASPVLGLNSLTWKEIFSRSTTSMSSPGTHMRQSVFSFDSEGQSSIYGVFGKNTI
ncbi:unnamed protein product [Soboliphyme baturini]|uniref:SKICH domain-containing protein n=1 Tax=Soboliphyme baturini TaxID=241478 RepID=A0A183IW98_9BILA|nr:unnamed protein product [Soboliphyme baturini]